MGDFKEGSLVRVNVAAEYVPDAFLGAVGTVIYVTESSCKILVPNKGTMWLVKDDLELMK